MKNRVTPLLDKMRNELDIMYDSTKSSKARDDAKKRYDALKEIYKDIADNVDDYEVTKVLYEIMDIESAIAKTPTLLEDTCLVRYGHFDEEMASKIGEVQALEGFLSASYDDTTVFPKATAHFAQKCNRWKMTILAPKGTKGIRLNSYFNALTTEQEWLLKRDQKFRVLEWATGVPDPHCGTRKTVTIELIPD